MAGLYRRLANSIQCQKQLLDSINDAIEEFIGLKAPDGTYRYANPAFAQAVSRSPETMVGLDDAAIFGQGTAKRLALSDRRVLKEREAVTADEEVYLDGKIGRAHVLTPVTNAHLVCRLLLDKQQQNTITHY